MTWGAKTCAGRVPAQSSRWIASNGYLEGASRIGRKRLARGDAHLFSARKSPLVCPHSVRGGKIADRGEGTLSIRSRIARTEARARHREHVLGPAKERRAERRVRAVEEDREIDRALVPERQKVPPTLFDVGDASASARTFVTRASDHVAGATFAARRPVAKKSRAGASSEASCALLRARTTSIE